MPGQFLSRQETVRQHGQRIFCPQLAKDIQAFPGQFYIRNVVAINIYQLHDKLFIMPYLKLIESRVKSVHAVAGGELVAVGESPKEVRDIALGKHPHINPSVLLVPHEEDFVCAL